MTSIYICKLCPEKFAHRSSLSKHLRRDHNEVIDDLVGTFCEKCNIEFESQAGLKTHHSKKPSVFECISKKDLVEKNTPKAISTRTRSKIPKPEDNKGLMDIRKYFKKVQDKEEKEKALKDKETTSNNDAIDPSGTIIDITYEISKKNETEETEIIKITVSGGEKTPIEITEDSRVIDITDPSGNSLIHLEDPDIKADKEVFEYNYIIDDETREIENPRPRDPIIIDKRTSEGLLPIFTNNEGLKD